MRELFYLEDFNNILIIISTASRNYKKINSLIEEKFSKILPKDKYQIKLTNSEDSNYRYTVDFMDNNSNSLIISVGGDGSISEVSEAIYKANRDDIYFSFLPNGTGNDLARTIYPGKDIHDILNNLENIVISKLDLISVNDRTCINSCSFGFESLILKNSLKLKDKIPFLKSSAYFFAIFMTLGKIEPVEYKYVLKLEDDSIISGINKSIMNSINNGKYYGGGFMPFPDAEIDDGLLDFNHIDYISPLKLVSLISKYKKGKHRDLDVVHEYRIKSGNIKMLDDKETVGNIDGNLYEFNEMEFKILHNAINFVKFVGKESNLWK